MIITGVVWVWPSSHSGDLVSYTITPSSFPLCVLSYYVLSMCIFPTFFQFCILCLCSLQITPLYKIKLDALVWSALDWGTGYNWPNFQQSSAGNLRQPYFHQVNNDNLIYLNKPLMIRWNPPECQLNLCLFRRDKTEADVTFCTKELTWSMTDVLKFGCWSKSSAESLLFLMGFTWCTFFCILW